MKELLKSKLLESRSHVIFVESICTDNSIIESNIRATKVSMPDYKDMAADDAVLDFKRRIEHYETRCEVSVAAITMLRAETSIIQIHGMHGWLAVG